MDTIKFIKSFSKGQITIPKEMRQILGVEDEFWLRMYIDRGKIFAEPVEQKKDKAAYRQKLLGIKGDWINPLEFAQNRKQIESQLKKRTS